MMKKTNPPENSTLQSPQIGGKDLRAFGLLLSYSRPWKKLIAFSLALLTFSSLLGVLSARLLGHLIEKGLVARELNDALKFGFWVLILEVSAVFLSFWGRRILSDCASLTILAIREKLFNRLSDLPMTYFDNNPLGRTVTRMTYDVEGLEDFFSGTLARLLQATLLLFIALGAMLVTDFKMGAFLVLAIVPSIFATWAFRNPIRYWNREFAIRSSAINAKLSEFLNGIPVIRAFGAENWSQKRFDGVVNRHLEAAIKINVLNSWARPVVLICCQLPLLGLLIFGGKAVLAGTLGLGLFVTFIRYCEKFTRPISALAQEIHTIQVAFTSAERIVNFLTEKNETESIGPDGPQLLTEKNAEIEFKNVWMAYKKEDWVLKDVNFKIQSHEKIGLAGATGSGKTSTLSLIARLYELQKGEIYINQKSLRNYSRDSLRDRIGFISQDVVLFKGSVRENLSSGKILDEEKINWAAKQTELDRILARSGRSLDSHVLDQGANFSMGERQLMALTRVLLKDPTLLVMDEATANIDPELEEVIHEAVKTVMKNRSCLIIAHRLATLKDCSRILVFKSGSIIEEGSHEELIQKHGYYFQLFQKPNAELLPG